MGAKVGGIGAGALAWWQLGDPLLGIGLAIAGWVVENLAEDYGQKKLQEMRLKWHSVLSSLGQRQTELFVSEMQNRYPHLLPAARQMLSMRIQ